MTTIHREPVAALAPSAAAAAAVAAAVAADGYLFIREARHELFTTKYIRMNLAQSSLFTVSRRLNSLELLLI